jgi:hypothetical protein
MEGYGSAFVVHITLEALLQLVASFAPAACSGQHIHA